MLPVVHLSCSHRGLHAIPPHDDRARRRQPTYRSDYDERDPMDEVRAFESRHGVRV